MKKAILVILLAAALVVWLASFAFAKSATPAQSLSVAAVSLSDLGVPNPGLLPTNPFYFVKEWGRALIQLITSDPVKKAQLELDVVTEKAAELERVVDLNPTNADALGRALDNYESGVEGITSNLEGIDMSAENAGQLMSDIASQALKYQELLEELKTSHADAADKIETVQTKIDVLMQELAAKDTAPGKFRDLLDNAINSQRDDLGRELKALPFLDRLSESSDNPDVRSEVEQVKDDEILRFEGRFGADGLAPDAVAKILGQLPMTDQAKLKVIDDLRDYVNNAAIGAKLDAARADIVDKLSSGSEVTAGNAQNLIDRVNKLVADAEGTIQAQGAGYKLPQDIKSLMDNAKSLLDKANSDLQAERYGSAFGEANAALHTITNAIRNLSPEGSSIQSVADLSDELANLMKSADKQGLIKDSNPKLFALFDQIQTVLSGKPSAADLQGIEVMIAEAKTALERASDGLPSLLIPVPGAKSLGTTQSESNAVGSDNAGNTGAAKPEFCSEQYEPVCGADGSTYPNKCFADQAGAAVNYKGECKVEKQTNN